MITLSRFVRLLPVVWPLLICITITTPYIIAVSVHHVSPFLPSISKAATFDPQASVFGFLMTFVAFYGLVMVVSRYLQLKAVPGDLKEEVLRKVIKLNKYAVLFGICCLIGVVLVATVRSSAHQCGMFCCHDG